MGKADDEQVEKQWTCVHAEGIDVMYKQRAGLSRGMDQLTLSNGREGRAYEHRHR